MGEGQGGRRETLLTNVVRHVCSLAFISSSCEFCVFLYICSACRCRRSGCLLFSVGVREASFSAGLVGDFIHELRQ